MRRASGAARRLSVLCATIPLGRRCSGSIDRDRSVAPRRRRISWSACLCPRGLNAQAISALASAAGQDVDGEPWKLARNLVAAHPWRPGGRRAADDAPRQPATRVRDLRGGRPLRPVSRPLGLGTGALDSWERDLPPTPWFPISAAGFGSWKNRWRRRLKNMRRL